METVTVSRSKSKSEPRLQLATQATQVAVERPTLLEDLYPTSSPEILSKWRARRTTPAERAKTYAITYFRAEALVLLNAFPVEIRLQIFEEIFWLDTDEALYVHNAHIERIRTGPVELPIHYLRAKYVGDRIAGEAAGVFYFRNTFIPRGELVMLRTLLTRCVLGSGISPADRISRLIINLPFKHSGSRLHLFMLKGRPQLLRMPCLRRVKLVYPASFESRILLDIAPLVFELKERGVKVTILRVTTFGHSDKDYDFYHGFRDDRRAWHGPAAPTRPDLQNSSSRWAGVDATQPWGTLLQDYTCGTTEIDFAYDWSIRFVKPDEKDIEAEKEWREQGHEPVKFRNSNPNAYWPVVLHARFEAERAKKLKRAALGLEW